MDIASLWFIWKVRSCYIPQIRIYSNDRMDKWAKTTIICQVGVRASHFQVPALRVLVHQGPGRAEQESRGQHGQEIEKERGRQRGGGGEGSQRQVSSTGLIPTRRICRNNLEQKPKSCKDKKSSWNYAYCNFGHDGFLFIFFARLLNNLSCCLFEVSKAEKRRRCRRSMPRHYTLALQVADGAFLPNSHLEYSEKLCCCDL